MGILPMIPARHSCSPEPRRGNGQDARPTPVAMLFLFSPHEPFPLGTICSGKLFIASLSATVSKSRLQQIQRPQPFLLTFRVIRVFRGFHRTGTCLYSALRNQF